MFECIAEQMTQSLINAQIIENEGREIYRYGIQQGLTMILNLLTTLAIGLICGMWWQAFVFMLAYIPLRSYAGGYHAKTPFRCYLFSIALMVTTLLAIRIVHDTILICCFLMLLSCVCILLFAPVEDHNKPLDAMERRIYKKRTRWILCLEIIFAAISGLLGCNLLTILCCLL